MQKENLIAFHVYFWKVLPFHIYVLLESGQWLVVVDLRVMMFLTMPLDVLLGIGHFMHKNCELWDFFVYTA